MEQTQDYTPENVRSCFSVLELILAAFLLAMLGRCTKSDDGFEYMTGTWQREGAAVEYVFFDDSRFHQSDIPGGQWIWEQSAGRVDLLGNPRRIWRVRFHAADEVTVIESDTFKIYRK